MSLPPSGRRSRKATQLLNKEEEFKKLNAELEEKTACLITEADIVLRGQESLFSDISNTDEFSSSIDPLGEHRQKSSASLKTSVKSSQSGAKPKNKQRPSSGPSGVKKKETRTKVANRPQSTTVTQHRHQLVTPVDLVEERATFVHRINTLELEAADDSYIPSKINEDVLPVGADEMGADVTIRFLKAKLRVMQEELENVAEECRKKASMIAHLQATVKEKTEKEANLTKKTENLQNIIDKHKNVQEDVRTKNSNLEAELTSVKKELDSLKREKKQTSANKNTLEVRLNRALEEVEKHKLALLKSKESSKVTNDTDRKRFEQFQNENKKLEKQKTELMTAFKKQLKLIDVLKRQKMHIEAAKLLEFSEEEFIRTLDWGK